MSLKYEPTSVPQHISVRWLGTHQRALAAAARRGRHSRPRGHYPCTTQLKAQGPSRTCNESKEEEEAWRCGARALPLGGSTPSIRLPVQNLRLAGPPSVYARVRTSALLPLRRDAVDILDRAVPSGMSSSPPAREDARDCPVRSRRDPAWRQILSQSPTDATRFWLGVDLRKHRFAPGLPPGRCVRECERVRECVSVCV